MYYLNLLLLVLGLILFQPGQCLAEPAEPTSDENAKIPRQSLFPGMKHSKYLKPVDLSSNKNSQTPAESTTQIENIRQGAIWFCVPPGFVGTVSFDKANKVYVYDYKKNIEQVVNIQSNSEHKEVYGHQKDEKGLVWMCLHTPETKIEEKNGTKKKIHTVEHHPHKINPENEVMVFRQLSRHITLDDKTNTPQDCQQVETISMIRVLPTGEIRKDTSVKTFDKTGKPLTLSKTVSYGRKVSGFQSTVKTSDGFDLEKSFAKFQASKTASNKI